MTSTAAPAADFSCAICLDTATEPVVTRCGHLFCWECLDHWLHSAAGAPECPVCKGRVDENIAGDIIPLYGKGKQTASKAVSRPQPAAAPAATTQTTTAASTAAADPGMEAFFSRPTAYSYAPGRTGAHRAPPASEAAPQNAEEHHHPRPNAARAPPRPRPLQQPLPNVQMHMHNHGMPLTLGSSIFFFGGGGGMFLSILLIIAWAVYNFAPWREWRGDVQRWINRVRGLPEPEMDTPGEARRDGAHPAGDGPATSTNASATESAAALPTQQTMVRNLVFSILAVFVLFQLLLFM